MGRCRESPEAHKPSYYVVHWYHWEKQWVGQPQTIQARTVRNLAGRPQGDARIRRLLNKSLNLSEKEALAAFRRRWASTRYCQDMAELLAKLEGELNREGADGARGISVIVIRGDGAISPEEFRRSAEARMALEAGRRRES